MATITGQRLADLHGKIKPVVITLPLPEAANHISYIK